MFCEFLLLYLNSLCCAISNYCSLPSHPSSIFNLNLSITLVLNSSVKEDLGRMHHLLQFNGLQVEGRVMVLLACRASIISIYNLQYIPLFHSPFSQCSTPDVILTFFKRLADKCALNSLFDLQSGWLCVLNGLSLNFDECGVCVVFVKEKRGSY